LQRKLDNIRQILSFRHNNRYIQKIEKVKTVKTKCIMVDGKSHLYLITKSFIPTHNSFMGAAWMAQKIRNEGGYGKFFGLMGATYKDVKRVMVPAILHWFLDFEHGGFVDQQITFKNGTVLYCYSSETEGALGANLVYMWGDELGKWADGIVDKAQRRYDDMNAALRKEKYPQILSTSTPVEQHPWFDKFDDEINAGNPLYVRIEGDTFENTSLSEEYINSMKQEDKGTRRNQQEFHGIHHRDAPGAYWNARLLDQCRSKLPTERPVLPPRGSENLYLMGHKKLPEGVGLIDGRFAYIDQNGQRDYGIVLVRTIIGVDPQVKYGQDETGIIVASIYSDGTVYILEDASGQYHPNEMANKISELYIKHNAQGIAIENNQGGDVWESLLKSVNDKMIIIPKWQTQGKEIRAEATAAFYAQGRVKHVEGRLFIDLEKQMCSFSILWKRKSSPDRLDALNLAVVELLFRSPTQMQQQLVKQSELYIPDLMIKL
jgi:phage terminase large subunit-like protein